jgi:hypothetical protein
MHLQGVNLNADAPTETVRGEYTKAGDGYVTFL